MAPTSSSSRPSASTWLNDFTKILNKMMTRKDSTYFREPVAWKELQLFDYPQVIKKPMDLGSVKKNLESGMYKKPAEAAADVRLVFENAMTYNVPDSRVYNDAKSLGEFFENAWANVPSAFVTAEDILQRPPTSEALTDFVEKCHRISPDELGEVLKQLGNICPNCLIKRPDSNEVDVNVDLISGRAFHEINAYVDKIILDMRVFSSQNSSL